MTSPGVQGDDGGGVRDQEIGGEDDVVRQFETAIGFSDGDYPDFVVLGRVAAQLARAGRTVPATELAERIVTEARAMYERTSELVAAADVFRAAGQSERADWCLQSAWPVPDRAGWKGSVVVSGRRTASRRARNDAAQLAQSLAQLPDVSPLQGAQIFSAAELHLEAAQCARAALESGLHDPVDLGNDLDLLDRARCAAMLPRDEALRELATVSKSASNIKSVYWRARVLESVATLLGPLDTPTAAATLYAALKTAWLAGRPAIMDVVATADWVCSAPNCRRTSSGGFLKWTPGGPTWTLLRFRTSVDRATSRHPLTRNVLADATINTTAITRTIRSSATPIVWSERRRGGLIPDLLTEGQCTGDEGQLAPKAQVPAGRFKPSETLTRCADCLQILKASGREFNAVEV